MRVSLLLQREPFGEILARTLARFWTETQGSAFTVDWHDRWSPVVRRAAGRQVWLINAYLNAIFVPDAEQEIFDPVRREFSRSTVWWRGPVQRSYVRLALARPPSRWLAQAALHVTPAIAGARRILVVPGNHKIRLLNHAAGVSYGILKEGLRGDFMVREIEARQAAQACGVSVPALVDVSGDGRWFREEYVSGTPTNRLPAGVQAANAVRRAADALQRLHRDTRAEEPVGEYVACLQGWVNKWASVSHLLDHEARIRLALLAGGLASQALPVDSSDRPNIQTALTHGDFQPANILVNARDAWLIDWEYAGRRQAGYDALVFVLAARFPAGLADRVRQFVSEGWPAQAPIPGWPGLGIESREARRRHAALFLLEEMALRLEENAEPVFTRLDPGLTQLLVEVARWLEISRAQ